MEVSYQSRCWIVTKKNSDYTRGAKYKTEVLVVHKKLSRCSQKPWGDLSSETSTNFPTFAAIGSKTKKLDMYLLPSRLPLRTRHVAPFCWQNNESEQNGQLWFPSRRIPRCFQVVQDPLVASIQCKFLDQN